MSDEVARLLGVVPASVDGGNLTFTQGDLRSMFWIWKDPRDKSIFGWSVITYDAALHDPMERFGGMGIRINHPPPAGQVNPAAIPAACYPWPVSGKPLAAEVPAAIAQYGHPSLRFILDRHDLGLLLLADAPVHRGQVWSFTPANNEPGRLAQAILLARHAGDQDLEQAAMTKLRDRGEEPVAGPGNLFRMSVADWGRQYSRATGIDLSDLAGLKGKRPQYPGASSAGSR